MFRMAAAAGAPWKTRLPLPTQVVGTVTTSDGRGWSKQEAFVYADGYFDAATRQFRGFGATRRIELGNDEEATSIQLHTFDVGATAEALKGAELGVEVQAATGTVLRRETNSYAVRVYATGTDGRSVAGPERRVHTIEHIEGTTTPAVTREEWTYDDHGNVLVHTDWGVVDGADRLAGSDERITTTDYAQDLGRWLLGRPFQVVVTDAAGARLAETRTYYDGEAFVGLPIRSPRRARSTDPHRVVGRGRAVRGNRACSVRRARARDRDAGSARGSPRDRVRPRHAPVPDRRAEPARRRKVARVCRRLRPGDGDHRLVHRPRRPEDELRLHPSAAAPLHRPAG